MLELEQLLHLRPIASRRGKGGGEADKKGRRAKPQGQKAEAGARCRGRGRDGACACAGVHLRDAFAQICFSQSKLDFNHGWFIQAEAPPSSLSSFKRALDRGDADAAKIAFYFVHWLTGARAPETATCSKTLGLAAYRLKATQFDKCASALILSPLKLCSNSALYKGINMKALQKLESGAAKFATRCIGTEAAIRRPRLLRAC
eukprot:594676-Pleurochrysis_carterae.AAC.1